MKELTKRQKEILDFISEMTEKNGFPPTIREIGKKFKIASTNGVRAILSALSVKGYIRRKPLLSRGIEVLRSVSSSIGRVKPALVSVPLLGRISAGLPVLAVENVEGSIGIDRTLFPGDGIFFLKVVGNSMRDAGILNGDYVLAQQQNTADKGEIVVAMIGDEATVKRYFPEKNKVRLEPANPEFGPIIVEKRTPDFFIAGKVIGLLRKYR
ncbi:MAG: transcriptional repressor LexA [candidate division Zixibacteria bacterium]|nr:transcriptional repressor LexA [candidate division Zixibacteria bacterium]